MTRGKYAARVARRVESESVVKLTALLERAEDENARLKAELSELRREIEALRSKLIRDVAALADDRVAQVHMDAAERLREGDDQWRRRIGEAWEIIRKATGPGGLNMTLEDHERLAHLLGIETSYFGEAASRLSRRNLAHRRIRSIESLGKELQGALGMNVDGI